MHCEQTSFLMFTNRNTAEFTTIVHKQIWWVNYQWNTCYYVQSDICNVHVYNSAVGCIRIWFKIWHFLPLQQMEPTVLCAHACAFVTYMIKTSILAPPNVDYWEPPIWWLILIKITRISIKEALSKYRGFPYRWSLTQVWMTTKHVSETTYDR